MIGHNQPSPFDMYAVHIGDLFDEAQNWLDGSGVNSDADAEGVSRLLSMLRKAAKDADGARADEKRPHDDAAKAVQAKWKPLLDKAQLAIDTAKSALTPYLTRKEAEQRAEAERLRQEAEEAARKAREAHQASGTDLAAAGNAVALETVAEALQKAAKKAEGAKAHAKGGERAVGLRSVWSAEVQDFTVFARWAWEHRGSELRQFLRTLADREVSAGARSLPGVTITEERKAA